MRNATAAIVSAALAVGALFGYVATATSATHAQISRPGVYCVQEDSCDVDYSGVTNRMIVRQVTP